jgi:hypothetical protein
MSRIKLIKAVRSKLNKLEQKAEKLYAIINNIYFS